MLKISHHYHGVFNEIAMVNKKENINPIDLISSDQIYCSPFLIHPFNVFLVGVSEIRYGLTPKYGDEMRSFGRLCLPVGFTTKVHK